MAPASTARATASKPARVRDHARGRGGFTFPFRLSTVPVTDIDVVSVPGRNYLLTWAAPDFLEPQLPGALDLRYTSREEGNALGTEMTVPGPGWERPRSSPTVTPSSSTAPMARSGPSGEGWATAAMDALESIARRGLWHSLAVSQDRAVVTWLDPVRSRLRLAQLAR